MLVHADRFQRSDASNMSQIDNREYRIETARLAMLIPAVRRSFLTSALSIAIFSALLIRFSPIGLPLWLLLRASVSGVGLVVIRRLSSPTATSSQQQAAMVKLLAASGVV